MEREPLGLHTWASHPAVTDDARQAGDRSSNTDLELHLRHQRPPRTTHSTRATSCRTPASDYYGGSAPPRPDRSTVDPAQAAALEARGRGEGRDGSRVHCDSLDEGGARLCPCGIATTTPQHVTVASGRTTHGSARSSPTPLTHQGSRRVGYAPLPALIRQVRAGSVLRDFETPVPRVLLSITLAGPAPSGSASTPRRCQDCSRPPRHLPDQAVLSFTALLRQGRWRWSLTSARIVSASRRTGWNPKVRFQVAAAFLLAMRDGDGGVEVQTQLLRQVRAGPCGPRRLPRRRPGRRPGLGPQQDGRRRPRSSTRHVDATGPNRSCRSVSTAMPLIASAPSATATARPANTRPDRAPVSPWRCRSAPRKRRRPGRCTRHLPEQTDTGVRHHALPIRADHNPPYPACYASLDKCPLCR